MTQIKTTKIPQRQECVNKEHPYIGGAKDVIDDELGKPQSEVNQETNESLSTHAQQIEDLQAMEQIVIDGGDAQIAQGSDFDNPDSAKRAKIPTVGAVLDGISEGVFDLTAKTGDSYASLQDALTAANTAIPANKKKGGIQLSFVHSVDNNYVQYRLLLSGSFTDVQFENEDNWQDMDTDKKLDKKWRYYIKSNTITDAYEEGLGDLFIDNTLLPITSLFCRYSVSGANQRIYIGYKTETQTTWADLLIKNISDITNNTIIDIVYNNVTIGYFVISNKQKFIDNPTFGNNLIDVNIVTSKRLHSRKDWQKITSDEIEDNAVIPSKIPNDSIIPSKIPNGSIGIDKLNKRFYKDNASLDSITLEYEKGLKNIYIDPSLLPVQTVSMKCYNGLLYISYIGIPNAGWKALINGMNFNDITNGVKRTFAVNNVVVGYVVFSNKQKFVDNPTSANAPMIIEKITSKWEQELVDANNIEDNAVVTGKIDNKAVTFPKTNFSFYKQITQVTEAYTEGLQDVFIDYSLLPITNFAVKSYTIGGIAKLYVSVKTATLTSWTDIFVKELSSLNNDTIIKISYNNVVVGYFVLKDKQKFIDNPYAGATEMYVDAIISKKDIYHSKGFFNDFANVEDIKNYCSKNLTINLPSTIYAVVGTEINLWNDAISYSLDKGLVSPTNYKVYWSSGVGMLTDRGYRFTPTSEQAGNQYTLTCRIYDVFGNVITSKNITIKVLAKNALSTTKNIVFFGDSTGAGTANIIYDDFQNTNKYSGTIPNMLGTIGDTAKYEADGGRTWRFYATGGVAQFRCFISSDAPTIPLNATYTNNGYTWTVKEVNITEGAGNILITKNSASYNEHPTNGGTLVATQSGVSDIVFDSYTTTPSNPLWDETLNDGAGGLSISRYKTNLGVEQTTKFDAVAFFLGLNGNTEVGDTLIGYIKTLYNLFINDNSNCKFIIGLISASNTEYGWGINYGTSIPSMYSKDIFYEKNKLYLSLSNDPELPNLRICPAGSEIDRYYGYMFENRAISQRYPNNESVHSNAVHPATSGYGQFGDAFFANYIGVLTE